MMTFELPPTPLTGILLPLVKMATCASGSGWLTRKLTGTAFPQERGREGEQGEGERRLSLYGPICLESVK